MYYILTSKVEDDNEDAILEGDSSYLRRIDCSFQDGISLPFNDIDTPIVFDLYEYNIRGTMTDHLNISYISGPVFSLNTKTLLEKKRVTNIEYYQLTLLDKFPDGNKYNNNTNEKPKTFEYRNYFITNVVGLIDCVNHEKSILEYFYPPELRNSQEETTDDINNPFAGENPNDIDFITKLVLDESKIDPSLKIFRLYDKPDLLVFHESIVEAIRKEGLSGFVFVPVDKYTDAIQDEEENDSKKEEQQEPTIEQKKVEPHHEPAQKQEAPPPAEDTNQPKKRKFFYLD